MYGVVCHEGGFSPSAHNYLLLLPNVRSVIIFILQRVCGYRRLNNSWSHTATAAWASLFSYSGLLDMKGLVPSHSLGSMLPCGTLPHMLTCSERLTRMHSQVDSRLPSLCNLQSACSRHVI